MNAFHHTLRKIAPFLYERNWYTGQFEFAPRRAAWFATAVGFMAVALILAWWMGQPVEYVSPR